MIKNYILTAIRTLRQNPLYTVLSVFGIALTFVFVCILILLVKNINGDFIPPKYAERTWSLRWIQDENGKWFTIGKDEYKSWIPKMKTPEISLVTSYKEEAMIINDQTVMVTALGVSENYYDICRFKFLYGRPLNKQEIIDNIPVTVIDKSIANMSFGKSENAIGKNIELNGIQYQVVGVVENSSLFAMTYKLSFANVWVPVETLKTLNQSLDYVIWFTAKNKNSIDEIHAEFNRVLSETNIAGDSQYSIPLWYKEILIKNNPFSSGISQILILLILMLIPALNILSLNVCKSYDRSNEIAIRKAFGAPISTIFGQLFFENFLLTFTGAVIGMSITPLILNSIDNMILDICVMPMSLSLFLNWKNILFISVPCVLLFSFLSGSIPAWVTAKRQIVNVLKGESL